MSSGSRDVAESRSGWNADRSGFSRRCTDSAVVEPEQVGSSFSIYIDRGRIVRFSVLPVFECFRMFMLGRLDGANGVVQLSNALI